MHWCTSSHVHAQTIPSLWHDCIRLLLSSTSPALPHHPGKLPTATVTPAGFVQAPQTQAGFGQAPQTQAGFGQAPPTQAGFVQASQTPAGFVQAPQARHNLYQLQGMPTASPVSIFRWVLTGTSTAQVGRSETVTSPPVLVVFALYTIESTCTAPHNTFLGMWPQTVALGELCHNTYPWQPPVVKLLWSITLKAVPPWHLIRA